MTPPQPPSQTLREACRLAMEACRDNLKMYDYKNEQALLAAFKACEAALAAQEASSNPNIARIRDLENSITKLEFERDLARQERDALSQKLTVPQPDLARERAAWEAGFMLCRAYGDNWTHFDGEQKERQWASYLAACRQEQP